MSNDQRTSKMNPFDALSNDPILHIFSFLPGKDLLKLSEIDRKFKRIVTTSKTMEKIRLVVDSRNCYDLDDVIDAAKTRQFTALKLVGVSKIFARPVTRASLLELLSASVEDLVIEDVFESGEENFRNIIQMFLPKLKSCTLNDVVMQMQHKESNNKEEACYHGSTEHRLETLKLSNSSGEVLTLFAGCSQLKSFEFHGPISQAADSDYLNGFLARQPYLEKLSCQRTPLAWNRLTCIQLKELAAWVRDEVEAAELLEKLNNLKTLNLITFRHPSRRLMQAICESPTLKSLGISTPRNLPGAVFESLKGLENRIVKKLVIIDGIGVTAQLLQLFRGVASISLELRTIQDIIILDLSDVPYTSIGKIKKIDASEKINIRFSPNVVPENLEGFESAVLKFSAKFSSIIASIMVGRESWLERKDVRLSKSFRENLSDCLPDYVMTAIYVGEDHSELSSQNEDDEPEPKKI